MSDTQTRYAVEVKKPDGVWARHGVTNETMVGANMLAIQIQGMFNLSTSETRVVPVQEAL